MKHTQLFGHWLFLFCLTFYSSHLQAQSGTLVDSLDLALRQETIDTQKINLLNALVRNTLFTQTGKASIYARHFDSIAEVLENPEEMARGTNFIAMCFAVGNQPDSAIDYYLKALQEYETLNDTLYQGIILNNIGSCTNIRGQSEETISFYLRALEKFRQVNNNEWIGNALNNIGSEYVTLSEYEKAISYYRQALPHFRELDKHYEEAIALSNIGNAYVNLNKWNEAIPYLYESIDQLPVDFDYATESAQYYGLGIAYLQLGQHTKAKKWLDQALDVAQKNDLHLETMLAYEGLAAYHQQTRNLEEAIGALNLKMQYRDSIIQQDQDQAMVEALQKFETEKKDQEIALLLTQNELNDVRLAAAQRQRTIYLIGLLALSVIAFLIYRQLKLRHKSEQVLQEKNQIITTSLTEKDTLLREIHHRVKNNLQFISSLLRLQSRYIKDPGALDALKDGQDRVRSMALIHQKLYQEDNLTGIEVKDYFKKLIQSLFDSYNISPDRIHLEQEVENLNLDVDSLIPLGLIVNELLSNALKHAFPEDRKGKISVSLKEFGDQLVLIVKDDGIGIPNFDQKKLGNSFGYKLINIFKQQMDAEVDVTIDEGTAIKIMINDYKKVA